MFRGGKTCAAGETVALHPGRVHRRLSFRVRSVTDSVNAPLPPRSAPVTPPGVPVVGMVGGGQLARMTSQAATGLGVGFRVLAGSAAESAAQVVAGICLGDYRSLADLRDFAAGCDVLTFDHEHVPDAHLAVLEQHGVQLRPASAALRFTQDKLAMRERLTGLGVACPRFAPVRTLAEVEEFADGGWPVVLKAVSGGYDGKGVWVCDSAAQAADVLAHGTLLAKDWGVIAEEYVAFDRELAVLAARAGRGVPGGADGPAGRHLPRGDCSCARPGARTGGAGCRACPAGRRGARRDRAAGGGDVRDAGRAARQRARDAPA